MAHALSDHFPFGDAIDIAERATIPGVDTTAVGAAISFATAVVDLLERMSGLLERLGLTPARWRLLVAIAFQAGPDGATVGELAGHLSVSAPTVTGTVDRLVADGLVRRAKEPHDRRIVRIVLTDSGRSTVSEIAPLVGARMSSFTRRMGGPGDLEALAVQIRSASEEIA